MDPSKRFATVVLSTGIVVLLAAILLGERMGDRVLGEATHREDLVPSAIVTPAPEASLVPYGPDWKRTQTITAAADPHFPDPRVPPEPLPTPIPPPTAPPAPRTPTPNPNIPIWDQRPFRKLPVVPAPAGGTPLPSPTSSTP